MNTNKQNLEEIMKYATFEEVSKQADEIMSNNPLLSLDDAMKQAIKKVYVQNKTKEALNDRPDLQEKLKKFQQILNKEN